MLSEACQELAPPALLAGIEQFNRGEYYTCHDKLEELWMAETRPIRELYKGILQIGVAFYHLRSGRYRPVITLMERGSNYLQPFSPVCMGVDVARLRTETARCLTEVKELGPKNVNSFDWSGVPKIKLESRE